MSHVKYGGDNLGAVAREGVKIKSQSKLSCNITSEEYNKWFILC